MTPVPGAILLTLCLQAGAGDTRGAAHHGPRPDEARMLKLVNRERVDRRLAPLRWNDSLARLADDHAADMLRMRKTTHHSSADDADFTARLARSNVRARAAAENVAFAPDVERAHRGLMDSPGHRRNILDPGLTEIGIAVLREVDGGSLYIVQDFATPIVDLSDDAALESAREAVRLVRSRSGKPPLAEQHALSSRLLAHLEKLMDADSVEVGTGLAPAPAWVIAYTTAAPGELVEDAVERVGRAEGFAMAAGFRRTKRYPFGTYWVILALTGETR